MHSSKDAAPTTVTRVEHVGVIVDDLDSTSRLLTDTFGMRCVAQSDRDDRRIAYFEAQGGGTRIELIEPTDPALRAARLGIGRARVEHIALLFEDLDASLKRLARHGVMSAEPHISNGFRTTTTQPETTGGVIFQLSEADTPATTAISTADVCDSHGDAAAVCELTLKDFGGVKQFSGRVATVRCFEDNVLMREALAQDGRGRILVVDGGGSERCALVGDVIAGEAVKNGWAGVVLNGAVRDSASLATMSIGVKALATAPRASRKERSGDVDVPVIFGGLTFTPGMTLYADADGVVVVAT